MNIGIIGLGLIGGSLGRVFIKNTDNIVYGTDISKENLLKAKMLGAFHLELNDNNYSDIDMLFIALCPKAFCDVLSEIAPKLHKGAIIVDIAGNKNKVVNSMKKISSKYPELKFIATHPMAGREYSGIKHSMPTLFENSSILIVPVIADIQDVVNFKALMLKLGFSKVIMTDAENHDRIIAYTSQLAHILSSSYVKSPLAEEHYGFSAGSFRDLTRVAKLNVPMWSELFMDNRENLLSEIDTLIDNLNEYREALGKKDIDKLMSLLEQGNERKEMIEKNTRIWKKS